LREVSILLDEERHEQRTAVAAAASDRPDGAAVSTRGGVHGAISAAVRRTPDAVALSWADGALTYAELDAAADRLAAALAGRGVRAETPVAVLLPRGPEYVIAMLAILKAGGVIVPLDPSMPGHRIAEILRQTSAPIVVDQAVSDAVRASCAAWSPP